MMSLTGSLYRERNFWVSSDDTDALNEFPVFSVGKKLAADENFGSKAISFK